MSNFYSKTFNLIFTIVSGKLWGRFLQLFMANINKIINIPYVIIFTSQRFQDILLENKIDDEHILSYDILNKINDPFYNPGGVISSYEELIEKIKLFKIGSECKIKLREGEKHNYEGLLTFEYLQNEEDLLAPALYKEIITNEPIKDEEIQKLFNYFLSLNNNDLNNIFLNLKNYENIPFEVLTKYLARTYTYKTDIYKTLNNDLMKSKMFDTYRTYIKLLYNGIEIKSFSSYTGNFLYRGSRIKKSEVDKIMEYKEKGKLNNIVVFSKAFLSFSETESEAMTFLGKSDKEYLGILFVLENFNKNNLSENGIYEFENNLSSFFYYHPTIIENRIKFKRKFEKIDIEIRIKNELFNIRNDFMNYILIISHFIKNQIINYTKTFLKII